MKFVHVIIGFTLLVSFGFALTYNSMSQCVSLANSARYIDAGRCYEQFKVWDKCSYYLLKGAREAEKTWNFNKGDWDGRVIALEYYGSPHTIGCLQNWGKYDLANRIGEYRSWLVDYLVSKADPPFDMDVVVSNLHDEIWPPKKISTTEKIKAKLTQVIHKENTTNGTVTYSVDPVLAGVAVSIILIAVIIILAVIVKTRKSI